MATKKKKKFIKEVSSVQKETIQTPQGRITIINREQDSMTRGKESHIEIVDWTSDGAFKTLKKMKKEGYI